MENRGYTVVTNELLAKLIGLPPAVRIKTLEQNPVDGTVTIVTTSNVPVEGCTWSTAEGAHAVRFYLDVLKEDNDV